VSSFNQYKLVSSYLGPVRSLIPASQLVDERVSRLSALQGIDRISQMTDDCPIMGQND